MERFGIYELRKTKASLLSGGEQQRVAIARVFPEHNEADDSFIERTWGNFRENRFH